MATFKILGVTFCIYLENKIKKEANYAIVESIKCNVLEEFGPVRIPAKYKPFSIEWHVYKDAFNRDRSRFLRNKMKSNKIIKEHKLSESEKLAATLSAEERKACARICDDLGIEYINNQQS